MDIVMATNILLAKVAVGHIVSMKCGLAVFVKDIIIKY